MKAILALAALTLLAACGSKETKQNKGASFGQVLPGSASDAMLPYDTASSAPPPAPETYDAPEDAGSAAKPKQPKAETQDAAPEAEAT
jgi:uncharacterized lipoprotein